MARVRSPNYPAVDLPAAIDRAKRIYDQEQHIAAPREVIAKHLGYGGLNGASLKIISALIKYGLLTAAGDSHLAVSELALAILYPESPHLKAIAIQQAAFKPALFSEFKERWPSHAPSDENLRSYLVRRNFAKSAIDGVIQSFRDTVEFVEDQGGGYAGNFKHTKPEMTGEPARQHAEDRSEQPKSTVETSPFRISIDGNAIEVAGRLTTPEQVDMLVKLLELNKVIIQPVRRKMPTEYTDDEEGQIARERDIQRMK